MSASLCIRFLCLLLWPSLGSSSIELLDKNLLGRNYDKRILPSPNGKYSSFTVGVSMYILDVISVDMFNMDMTVSMYFRQFWVDSRLAFERGPGAEKVVGRQELLERIWLPDTFFVNARQLDVSKNTFIRVNHNGDVLWSQLLTVKFSCPMDLQYFPFDSQLCSLEMESFAHTMADFKYRFNDGMASIQISPDASLPEYSVIGHRQRVIELSLSSGNYSRLVADIQVRRSSGYYTLAFFIPVSGLVMITWISFWMSPSHPAARLALLVPPLIIILAIICVIHFSIIPWISYITALTIYTYLSLFMVLLAFVPFILVTVLQSFLKEKLETKSKKIWTHPIFIIETVCKFLFPIIFGIVQHFFFKFYQNLENSVDDLIKLN